jgi:multidrug efflux system membrane fusion protein
VRNRKVTTVLEVDEDEPARDAAVAQVATLIDEDFPFAGPIDYVSNEVDSATGTIQLRAVLPNEEMRLFPGLFVRVRIPMELLEGAVLIREEALGTDLGGRYVYVVGDDNIVERRYVTLGVVEPDGMVPILEGLDGSETYIVDGLLRARPGMPVTPDTVSDTPERDDQPQSAHEDPDASGEAEEPTESASEDG